MDKFARNLDWNLLYTFMVIVQEEGIVTAAERLLVTQPAVSLALKRLEETVGIRLIDRGSGKLAMTPAGEALYPEACRLYAAISRLPVTFNKAPQSVSGKISISTLSQVISSDFDTTLSNFFKNHPKVELSISVKTVVEIVRELELGQITLGLCSGIIPDILTKRWLLKEEFGLFCGKPHSLFGKSNLTLDDLREEPFVGFIADILGGKHMSDVTALRAKASIGQFVRGRSCNVSELRRMIEIGLGIGFLPLHLAAPYVQSGSLWRLPPYDEVPNDDIYLIYNPAINFSPAERIFLAQLFETNL
ncbi:MAG: LysR family transcriptional regulator [Desulfobacula sp.]|uniref:LysR family transcriptional regulator n=1 Tax=Desulfobacula sp. TaxID=2593537 RepID=UPI0025B99D8E|nr:LysR family transcriptional regulator [Desulfobacula sp.]MCD4720117.1 LysR family transcriptional regulator [Desulfobacula sp.]